MAENFFSILKTECIYRQEIKDFAMAKSLIDEYIHFYNHERIQLRTKQTPLNGDACLHKLFFISGD